MKKPHQVAPNPVPVVVIEPVPVVLTLEKKGNMKDRPTMKEIITPKFCATLLALGAIVLLLMSFWFRHVDQFHGLK